MFLDSQAARRAAGEVQSAASKMGSSAQVSSKAQAEFTGQLYGRFAETLEEELKDFSQDLQTLQGGLDGIRASLIQYAEKIEAIDRLAEKIIRLK